MTTRGTTAISATGLRKSFGDKLVLDGIDLTVPEATVFALLGPQPSTTVHVCLNAGMAVSSAWWETWRPEPV